MGRQHSFYHCQYSYKHNIKQFRPKFQVSLPLHRVYAKMIVSLPIQPIVLLKKSIQYPLPSPSSLSSSDTRALIRLLMIAKPQSLNSLLMVEIERHLQAYQVLFLSYLLSQCFSFRVHLFVRNIAP